MTETFPGRTDRLSLKRRRAASRQTKENENESCSDPLPASRPDAINVKPLGLPAHRTHRMEKSKYPYPLHLGWHHGPERLKTLRNKLLLYFQSHESCGGDCDITDTECSAGYVLLRFTDQKARDRVLRKKSHILKLAEEEISLRVWPPDSRDQRPVETPPTSLGGALDDREARSSKEKVPETRDHPVGSYSMGSSIQKGEGSVQPDQSHGPATWSYSSHMPAAAIAGHQDSSIESGVVGLPDSTMKHSEDIPAFSMPEIFGPLTGMFYSENVPALVREEIKEKFPFLKMINSTDGMKVTASYDDFTAVYRYFEERMGARRENSPDIRSGEEELPNISSALWEYVKETYRAEMDDIERSYQVKIVQHHISNGSTYLNFIPQGSQSSPKSAQDKFTDKVQEVMGDWSQEKVDSSIVQLPLADLKQSVKDLWSKVLVIQQDSSLILRGPKEQISEAKKFLETRKAARRFSEKEEYKSARPRRPVTLSSSNTLTEIPVDRRHLDILRRLKSREISDIEQKYQVQMEDGKKSKKDGIVFITFRAVNGCPDLSPHAAHSFITLLQKTLFNVKKTVIRLGQDYTEERVHSLQEKLKAGGADLIMECSDGSLHIIGHPLHVSFAVDIILGIPESNGAQAAPMSEMDREEPMDTSEAKGDEQRAEEDDKCPICLSMFSEKEVLPKCKHAFCRGCLKQAMAHKPVCPICSLPYGEIRGDQPDGTMTDRTHKSSLPGYSGHGTIEITYSIPNGIQQENHPRPGTRFHGATRKAYLPDNMEGREILRLLRKAFDRRLIFTVGDSRTTGATDTVTWNDIHHKTSTHGGTGGFGYPDPNYLKRVRDELKAKGIE